MDLVSITGLILGFVLLAWAILSGSSPKAFVDVASVILVVGGSIASTMISMPGTRLKETLKVIKKGLFHSPQSIEKLIADLVSYAEVARRDGILSLETMCKEIKDPFIVRGIQMAVDGTDPELIQQIMETELENLMDRHEAGKSVLATLGKYAPAFGMIGTLVGLVIMLANMKDPSAIGPGMAVALLTTLYGAVLSNVVFLPLVDRLSARSGEEVLLKTIIIKGVMAIQSGDNPRIVEQKLRTFLPPALRKDEKKDAEAA